MPNKRNGSRIRRSRRRVGKNTRMLGQRQRGNTRQHRRMVTSAKRGTAVKGGMFAFSKEDVPQTQFDALPDARVTEYGQFNVNDMNSLVRNIYSQLDSSNKRCLDHAVHCMKGLLCEHLYKFFQDPSSENLPQFYVKMFNEGMGELAIIAMKSDDSFRLYQNIYNHLRNIETEKQIKLDLNFRLSEFNADMRIFIETFLEEFEHTSSSSPQKKLIRQYRRVVTKLES